MLVVYDEAYTEYLPPEERPDAFAWVRRFPNLLVSRSFSKAYGLAGLRVGYGVAQPWVTDLLNRLRQPFNVNLMAQAAAVAALSDAAWLEQAYLANRAGLAQLESGLNALGLRWLPSRGNFLLVQVVPPADGVAHAAGSGDPAMPVYDRLLRSGVIVRPVGNYALAGWVRVPVGLPAEDAGFLARLPGANSCSTSSATRWNSLTPSFMRKGSVQPFSVRTGVQPRLASATGGATGVSAVPESGADAGA